MKQQRNTKQRLLVLDTVLAHTDHPSADQLYIEARRADSHISRGTVYRNLSCLAERGDISHVRVPGADRYEQRTQLHYHLLCTDCGAVCDAPVQYRRELDRSVAEASGYVIFRHRTVFEGLCPQCQARRERAAAPDEPSDEL